MYQPSKKYGMVKTRAYRKWLEHNIPLIKEGLDKAESFPVEIEIIVFEGRGFHDKSDIDNVNKALVDALVKAEILPDDNIKYVTKCSEKFMPFWTKKSEAVTILKYIEQEN